MADLLASLEIGISTIVDASSRLRNQITKIDEYRAYRQAEISSFVPASNVLHEQNQSYVVGDQTQRAQPAASSFGIMPDMDYQHGERNEYSHSMSQWPPHTQTGIPQQGLEFHIPPELLEDWPWPFDMQGTWDLQT